MNTKQLLQAVTAVLAVATAPSALAAGFALPEQSARAVGVAGTGTASAEGASALYYNPGLLGFEKGVSVELTGTLIAPSFRYEPTDASAAGAEAVNADAQTFTQPAVFIALKPTDRLAVGIGGFANYGLGITWPSNFPGRFDSSAANITTFTINPSAAYRIGDDLSIGVGVDIVRGTVELSQALNFLDWEGGLHLGGGAWGVGANAGIAARFMEGNLQLGFNYRSATALHFDGKADFSVPAEFQQELHDQAVSTAITLPHTFTLGGSYRVTPQLRANLDATYTTWSTLQSIDIHFAESEELNQSLRRDWFNTFTVRLGGEYLLFDALALRLGVGFDQSPSPDDTTSPSLPDSSRLFGSAGVGLKLGSVTVDVGYMLIGIFPRTTTPDAFPATYSGTAHLLSVSLGFRQQ